MFVPVSEMERTQRCENGADSLAHKSDFAGHVIVTTGLRRMHFPRPGIFLRWNSNLQQVDFSKGFASNNILGLVVLIPYIDLYCTLIGHFRALYQMYLSLGVDVGRGGSPYHRQI